MVRLADLPLGSKLSLSILGTCILTLTAVVLLVMTFSLINERRAMPGELSLLARIMADGSIAPLQAGSPETAREYLATLRDGKNIESACLYRLDEGQPRLFAEYHADRQDCPDSPAEVRRQQDLETLVPVSTRGQEIGLLYLRQNFHDLWVIALFELFAAMVSLMIALVLAWILAIQFRSWLTTPLIELASTANRIAETGDYSLRVSEYGQDEVGELIRRFNDMLARIENQDIELRESRNHLEERVAERTAEIARALHRLQETQNQLIQTEKLAALGGLVAGVAHEINTPVSVGMTAASSLGDSTAQLLEKLKDERLTRGELEDYARDAGEAADIILGNLGRAAELVRSFKQVAIDQAGLERRKIRLGEYVQDVLTSLHPALKKAGHEIIVDCPEDLDMDTFPGAISQILTNLVMNSLVHAFDEGQRGRIRILARHEGMDVRLVYEDNGRGMNAEYLAHAFEPFVSSRRSRGGSGLGLHIVHNIVTRTLGGNVRLTSEPGKGVRLVMLLPDNLPRSDA